MKKFIIAAFVVVCALFVLTGCHSHTNNGKFDCTKDEICQECGEIIKPAGQHNPSTATCTQDSICYDCGMVLSKRTGHTAPDDFDCTQDVRCVVCNDIMQRAKEAHVSEKPATCTEDELCATCGTVMSYATGHVPGAQATTASPQSCTVCGEILKYASASGTGEVDFVPETIAGGHYSNNIDAYYSGNVLVCGDYALEYFSLSTAGNKPYASIINDFAAKYPNLNVTSLLVPKSATFNAPEGYTDQFSNHQSFISNTYGMMNEGIKTGDAIGVMAQHKDEYMFYRTDHHWTSLGAYYASVAYCQANDITPVELDSYETVINTGFVGTLYSYCRSPKPTSLLTNPDYTVAHLPVTSYTTNSYPGTALVQSAKTYAGMFLGGDQGFMRFVTENKNGKKLVIFKESYGNAFAPYMLDYYEEVIVIDIRYATDSVASIIESYGITDALIINNLQGAMSLQSELRSKIMS